MPATYSPEEMAAYRASAAVRWRKKESRLASRRERALRVADRAAVVLRTDFGADRVVLFGSSLEPDRFHEHSDLDIAVWGVEESTYLRAVAKLLSLDPGISVDLVRVESASISLQTSIERDGVEL